MSVVSPNPTERKQDERSNRRDGLSQTSRIDGASMSANPGGFTSLQMKARGDSTEGQKTRIKKHRKGKNGDNSRSSSAAKRPLNTGPRESSKTQRTVKNDTGSSSRAKDMRQMVSTLRADVDNARNQFAGIPSCSASVEEGYMNLLFFEIYWDKYNDENPSCGMQKYVLSKLTAEDESSKICNQQGLFAVGFGMLQAKMSAVEKKCDVLIKGQEKIARMFSEAHNGPADVLSNHKNNPETTSNSSNLKVESRAVVTKWMKSNLLASPMGIFTTSNRNVTLGVPPFVGEIINDTRRPLVLSDGQPTQQKIIFLASTNLNSAKRVTLATASQYTANVLARPYARDFQGMSSHFESIFLCVTTYPDEDSYNAAMVANECDTRSITEEQMKKILHQVLICIEQVRGGLNLKALPNALTDSSSISSICVFLHETLKVDVDGVCACFFYIVMHYFNTALRLFKTLSFLNSAAVRTVYYFLMLKVTEYFENAPGTGDQLFKHSPGASPEDITANMTKFKEEAHRAYSHYRHVAIKSDQKSAIESLEQRFFRHTYVGEDEDDDGSDEGSDDGSGSENDDDNGLSDL
eukprot:CAMPEP_0185750094 /NCGR_PEP_ID=MMETSP1174-20130828/8807_1 /TAXON_ID=35687 /ORGANISM="Dictyocha speculum, Strain CCMP1381" /LENGTH=577 /DNA_ID=CAMNT_0028426487 /DNA_START=35 /DNA_END=1768 /DNA_ORIENTATION=-